MENKEHVLHHFKKIHDYVEKNGNANLKEAGLTLAQGHILRYLKHSEDGHATLKELEKQMKVAQSTLAGMVARLEEKGFVETYTDPMDKRIKIAKITERGIESTIAVRQSMEKLERKLATNLTEEELITLSELLLKVAKNCDIE